MRRSLALRSLALLSLALVLAPLGALAADSCPTMTRQAIIDLAKTGVGCPYVWGGTCWNPADTTWKGADCSGYVTKCWQVPAASAVTSCLSHYYASGDFASGTDHWTGIGRDELLPGDALARDGHVLLFEAYTSTTDCYQIYEARGTAYGIVYRVRCPDSTFTGHRRHNLSTVTPPPPPTGQQPKGTVEGVDCGLVRGWAQDPDTKTTSINVQIYFNGGPGQVGAVGYNVVANVTRSDLTSLLGSANHGFSMPVPSKMKDGKAHVVHVYGVDSAGGTNPELTGSPKVISCAPSGEAGPDPTPLDGGVMLDPDGAPTKPPNLETPDDNAPEHDLALTGSCGCAVPRSADGAWILLALALGVVLARVVRARRRR